MFNILKTGIQLLPSAIKIGYGIYDWIKGKDNQKKKECEKNKIKEAFKLELRKLNQEKAKEEEKNRRSEEKIANLELLLHNQLEEVKRLKIENEKKIIEKEKKDQEERLRKIEEEKITLEKCRESLDNEYSEAIFEIMNEFFKEEEKWINSLQGNEIETKINNLKNDLDLLFDELFEYEKIMEKINNKFINIIKTIFNPTELEKMNFIIIGRSGIGKSTLINEIFGEYLAEEGQGKSTTNVSKKYESNLVPFLSLLDTVGTEIGDGHKLIDVLQETLQEITNKLDNRDPNEHIHCILYCTSGNRIVQDELKVILTLRERYDGKKLPIVIVYTRATNDIEVESMKNAINEYLEKHNEKISDDIFGISFIKINAREEVKDNIGDKYLIPSFGLSNLMNTCFNKGKQSYIFAIKNSLIQIGKNMIKDYLQIIANRLVNNLDYFNYLHLQFEPNFSDYLAYCFEKITDINEQIGIKEEELKKLKEYLDYHHINGYKELSEVYCMVCKKVPKNPYICENCESEVCSKCYFKHINYKCENCEQDKFVKVGQIDNNEIEYENNNKIEDNDDEEELYLNNNEIKENKEDNYFDNHEKNKNEEISELVCLNCDAHSQNYYRCKICDDILCEKCYLKKFEADDVIKCNYCGQEQFEKIEHKEKNNIERNYDEDNDVHENEIIEKMKNEENLNLNENNNEENYKEYNEINEEIGLREINYCMNCKKTPINPLKCINCGYKICNQCYLTLLANEEDDYKCDNCKGVRFEAVQDEKSEPNNFVERDLFCFVDNNKILPNKLTYESINAINNYVEKFRVKLIEEFNKRFDEFANKAADDIYLKVVEKYIDLSDNENIKMYKMKSKKELREEAIEEINKSLKKNAEENFLSRIASQFFQDIVLKFKERCELKINDFINNLLNNEQANNFLKECQILNANKGIKFEKEINEYIKRLQEKEKESREKALKIRDQLRYNNLGGVGNSQSESQGDS